MARISNVEKEIIRNRIVEVSKKYFLLDGFDKTSTKKIAQEVGIAEGTLFNYFDSKVELFFEAISKEYEENDNYKSSLSLNSDICDAITIHITNITKPLLRIPKGLLSEMMIASIKIARKKPETFKKMAAIDMKYMNDLKTYFDQIIAKKLFVEVDSESMSEIVFSIIAYEVLMYLYNQSITKEDVYTNISKKVKITLRGYLKGEQI